MESISVTHLTFMAPVQTIAILVLYALMALSLHLRLFIAPVYLHHVQS
jgi:hypothetical protein